MNQKSLDYEEYYISVWENIPEIEISEQMRYLNEEQLRELIFKLHRLYSMGESVYPSLAAKFVCIAFKTGFVTSNPY